MREVHEDEPSSFQGDTSSVAHTTQVDTSEERIRFAEKENDRIWYIRPLLFLVLMATAFTMAALFFWYARASEHDDFEASFADLAHKLIEQFEVNSQRRVAAIESLAVTITSSAKAEGQTWPNVTLTDYERRASYVIEQAQVISVIFIPFITGEMKPGWEAYSVENQGWVEEGLELQGDIAKGQEDEEESIAILESTWGSSPNRTIPEHITKVTGTGLELDTEDGPYAVWWQFAPVFPLYNLVNYNTLSHPTRRDKVKAIMEDKRMVVSEAWDYSDTSSPATVGKKAALNLFLNRHEDIKNSYQDGPVSDLYMPIFEDHKPNSKVVGALTAYVYWQAYFLNILPPNSHRVIVVLSNSCGQIFTYSVDGANATYIGPGDLHDSEYDSLKKSVGFHADMKDSNSTNGQCIYKIAVYPSKEMQDDFYTGEPWIITAVILTAFLVTSSIFVLYDCLVQRRQKIVMNHAIKSTKVVNSLFPEEVRERMVATESQDLDQDNPDAIIADLYPEATVLFADLQGFTNWSAHRDPKDVFLLLQTLYEAFDAIAKRRRVFKIETIGDW